MLKDYIGIFSGNANRPLAEEVANILGVKMGDCSVKKFSDGEIGVSINQSVRGQDVFIIQPTIAPTDNIMELLIMIDAFRRASANRVIAVLPYYGYARQERKDRPRVAISAKLMANLIDTAGADRVVTMDLHADSIQGFFDIPVDHLYAEPILIEYFSKLNLDNLCVVAPDVGSVGRARRYSKAFDCPLAIIDKRRPRANVSEVMNIIGDVEGKNIIIIDDIVDTAGTLTKAADALRDAGALDIYAACSHALLSGPAIERINNSSITKFISTNTIPVEKKSEEFAPGKFEVLSVGNLLAEAIRRIYYYESISSLFDE